MPFSALHVVSAVLLYTASFMLMTGLLCCPNLWTQSICEVSLTRLCWFLLLPLEDLNNVDIHLQTSPCLCQPLTPNLVVPIPLRSPVSPSTPPLPHNPLLHPPHPHLYLPSTTHLSLTPPHPPHPTHMAPLSFPHFTV